MLDLLHHVLTIKTFWHLEYVRGTIIPSEYEKIKINQEEFSQMLLKRGEDIINDMEADSNVNEVTIFLKSYKVTFTKSDYSPNQLRQIVESLDKKENVETQNATKRIFIDKDMVIGYDITYNTKYADQFKKS